MYSQVELIFIKLKGIASTKTITVSCLLNYTPLSIKSKMPLSLTGSSGIFNY
jgi:hypothetical protein